MKKSVKGLNLNKIRIGSLSNSISNKVVGGSYNCPPNTLGCGGGGPSDASDALQYKSL